MTLNTSICLSSAYLAPVQYYTKLYAYPTVYVEQHDHYLKQTYRNRCIIATADGTLTLSVPTEKPATLKCLMKDVRISDHGNWRHLHWKALESAYRHSPFFEYYQDDFRPFYERKYEYLYDFNETLCALVCDLIDLHPHLFRTERYEKTICHDITDARELIHPKRSHETDATFRPQPYCQVFEARHGFLPNLSIVDLLFNMGPESLLVLRDSLSATE